MKILLILRHLYLVPILKRKTTFTKFAKKSISRTKNHKKNISQKVTQERAHFGEVHIHEYKSSWIGVHYKPKTIYFQVNGEFYIFNYSSTLDNYDKYITGANSIFESISFKSL